MSDCQCGCGGVVSIANGTSRHDGTVKGQPRRFIRGHHARIRTGAESNAWKGGRTVRPDGYVWLHRPEHPRAHDGYVQEHNVIAEQALGRLLPEGVQVHHFSESRSDNRNQNLVICENQLYHQLLHRRAKAYRACGIASARRCRACKDWAPESEMRDCGHNGYFHRDCAGLYWSEIHERRKTTVKA